MPDGGVNEAGLYIWEMMDVARYFQGFGGLYAPDLDDKRVPRSLLGQGRDGPRTLGDRRLSQPRGTHQAVRRGGCDATAGIAADRQALSVSEGSPYGESQAEEKHVGLRSLGFADDPAAVEREASRPKISRRAAVHIAA